MNRIVSVILLVLGVSQSLVIDQLKENTHAVNQERGLQLLGLASISSCKSQLETCQASTRVSKLPYTEWSQILDRIGSDQDELFDELSDLVGTFSEVDFLSSVKDTSPLSRAVNSTELQEMLKPLEEMEIDENAEVTLNQVGIVVNVISRIAGFLGLTFDFTFIQDIASVIDKVIAAQADGALYVWGNVAAALLRYAMPFILNLVQSAIDPFLCAEVMDCQFAQMASKVLPAMVQGAFDAKRYTP